MPQLMDLFPHLKVSTYSVFDGPSAQVTAHRSYLLSVEVDLPTAMPPGEGKRERETFLVKALPSITEHYFILAVPSLAKQLYVFSAMCSISEESIVGTISAPYPHELCKPLQVVGCDSESPSFK